METNKLSYDENLESSYSNVINKLDAIRINIKGKERLRTDIETDLAELVEKKQIIDAELLIDAESLEVFKSVVDSRNTSAKDKLESMLNFALSYVPLKNEYSIRIDEFNTKRSGREFAIKLLDKKANKLRGIRTQSGTAVAQLVSFLMRVVVISFSGSRRLLVIDENLSGFQDQETIRMFGEILVALAENEDFQVIMVEHKSEFMNVPNLHNYVLEKNSYTEGIVLADIHTPKAD